MATTRSFRATPWSARHDSRETDGGGNSTALGTMAIRPGGTLRASVRNAAPPAELLANAGTRRTAARSVMRRPRWMPASRWFQIHVAAPERRQSRPHARFGGRVYERSTSGRAARSVLANASSFAILVTRDPRQGFGVTDHAMPKSVRRSAASPTSPNAMTCTRAPSSRARCRASCVTWRSVPPISKPPMTMTMRVPANALPAVTRTPRGDSDPTRSPAPAASTARWSDHDRARARAAVSGPRPCRTSHGAIRRRRPARTALVPTGPA